MKTAILSLVSLAILGAGLPATAAADGWSGHRYTPHSQSQGHYSYRGHDGRGYGQPHRHDYRYRDRGHHYGHHRPYVGKPHARYGCRTTVVTRDRHGSPLPIIAGGAIGGVVGHELGHGDHVATAAGAVIGAVVGHDLGHRSVQVTRYRECY